MVNNQSAICDIQEFDVCFYFLGSIFLDLHTNTQKQKKWNAVFDLANQQIPSISIEKIIQPKLLLLFFCYFIHREYNFFLSILK